MAPIPGLPGPLPGGEELLWQGRPDWWALAQRAFRVRLLAVYFGALLVLRVIGALTDGASLPAAAVAGAWLAPLALAALGVLTLLAWLNSRATIVTITSRRVVLRFGVALPMTVNIPLAIVGSAGLKLYPDGTGDIPLELTGKGRLGYLHIWPYARPWHFARPQPMLRALPDAQRVAAILARAMVAATASSTHALPNAAKGSAPSAELRPLVTAA